MTQSSFMKTSHNKDCFD